MEERREGERALTALELSSLVASRLCHDLSGPVGAVLNGLELIEDGDGAAPDGAALTLVGRSADLAARRIAFARLAFGAYGGAKEVEAVEVERLVEGHLADGRARLDWRVAAPRLGRDAAKLLANLVALAAGAIPRGGVLEVAQADGGFVVTARGEGARLPAAAAVLGAGAGGEAAPEPRNVEACLARLLAEKLGRRVEVVASSGEVVFRV